VRTRKNGVLRKYLTFLATTGSAAISGIVHG
jgi:hypothetical protein